MSSYRAIQLQSQAVHHATIGQDKCREGVCLNKRMKGKDSCYPHQMAREFVLPSPPKEDLR